MVLQPMIRGRERDIGKILSTRPVEEEYCRNPIPGQGKQNWLKENYRFCEFQ